MVKQVIAFPNKQLLRAWIPQYNYVNTNEIELSRENMISSQVKITCYLHTWKDHHCYCSVGWLWHFHGKNPVRLYPRLQSQPIGLRKIFIDYLFFKADQSDCTKSVSIFNRFASSEERWNQNVPCQICRAWVFPLVVYDGLLTSKILTGILASHERRPKPNYFFPSWFFFV